MRRVILIHVEVDTQPYNRTHQDSNEAVRQTIEDILPTITLQADARVQFTGAIVLSQMTVESYESLEQLIDGAIDALQNKTAQLQAELFPGGIVSPPGANGDHS